ncbi:MAG: acyl-CoA thioesterase [Alphaproteobacteria bacterium]|nr:acyl-CoA thioesterase [Alphaproteobacteria bacterium]
MAETVIERRAAYGHFRLVPTRWMDNDVYGHVNNVVYYSYFDTVVNLYLIHEGGLDFHAAPVIGIVAESMCRFRRALAYPEVIEAGLRVGRLGNSSVRYEIALFRQGDDEAAADGHFVHVFVDRQTRRPTPIPPVMRAALARIAVA